MRLVTVAAPDGTTVAAVREGEALHALEDAGGALYRDLGALFAGGFNGTAREPLEGEWRIVRPVTSPAATVCVGINYGAHIKEMGRELPTSPTLFLKLAQALLDPDDDVVIPPESSKIDYEGELVAVIGRGGRRIPRGEAMAHVAGLTLMNDVTMRDFQYRSLQWFAGKSWRASTPVGPEVVTLDELDELESRQLTTTVNGAGAPAGGDRRPRLRHPLADRRHLPGDRAQPRRPDRDRDARRGRPRDGSALVPRRR